MHSSPTQDKTGFHAVAPLSGLLALLPESQAQTVYWKSVLWVRGATGKSSYIDPRRGRGRASVTPQCPQQLLSRTFWPLLHIQLGPIKAHAPPLQCLWEQQMTGWALRPYPTPRTWFSGTWERPSPAKLHRQIQMGVACSRGTPGTKTTVSSPRSSSPFSVRGKDQELTG